MNLGVSLASDSRSLVLILMFCAGLLTHNWHFRLVSTSKEPDHDYIMLRIKCYKLFPSFIVSVLMAALAKGYIEHISYISFNNKIYG